MSRTGTGYIRGELVKGAPAGRRGRGGFTRKQWDRYAREAAADFDYYDRHPDAPADEPPDHRVAGERGGS